MPFQQFVKPVCAEGQMELLLSQVIGLGSIPQPGQLQPESGLSVSQVDQLERAVGGVFLYYEPGQRERAPFL